jgi:hypothetical protein
MLMIAEWLSLRSGDELYHQLPMPFTKMEKAS